MTVQENLNFMTPGMDTQFSKIQSWVESDNFKSVKGQFIQKILAKSIWDKGLKLSKDSENWKSRSKFEKYIKNKRTCLQKLLYCVG